jgi:hydroxyquinol 1,2-dioxygenase
VHKPGFDTLITHLYVQGDEYLDSDAVFGVRASRIGAYVHREPGKAPDGTVRDTAFVTPDQTLSLAPA